MKKLTKLTIDLERELQPITEKTFEVERETDSTYYFTAEGGKRDAKVHKRRIGQIASPRPLCACCWIVASNRAEQEERSRVTLRLMILALNEEIRRYERMAGIVDGMVAE